MPGFLPLRAKAFTKKISDLSIKSKRGRRERVYEVSGLNSADGFIGDAN
jgi:hypothetical protein